MILNFLVKVNRIVGIPALNGGTNSGLNGQFPCRASRKERVYWRGKERWNGGGKEPWPPTELTKEVNEEKNVKNVVQSSKTEYICML